MEITKVTRLVKSEDLNHHGTLFAGRMAEWFVEASFISGAKATNRPENIVCVNVHGLNITSPANKGDILNLEARIAKAGRSSFVTHGKITRNSDYDNTLAEGFITFVFVDENGKSMPHGLVLSDPIDEEDAVIRERANNLK